MRDYQRVSIFGGASVSTLATVATSPRNSLITSGFGCDAAPKFVRRFLRCLRPASWRLGRNSATQVRCFGHMLGLVVRLRCMGGAGGPSGTGTGTGLSRARYRGANR